MSPKVAVSVMSFATVRGRQAQGEREQE